MIRSWATAVRMLKEKLLPKRMEGALYDPFAGNYTMQIMADRMPPFYSEI
ncbi:hypothetical protein OFY17_03130 [Marinomonas sp. C2222]|uniref:Uncharacterized protein n=1 Tax=Marinomonas sargassi TaxID=2984494 RepID=A0ABT2YPQ9_9GAMM|nr:hypothetical protein [Marinomonas sargassi]MCV2401871.1 hypothetical protein [Marinomonas sargassi]